MYFKCIWIFKIIIIAASIFISSCSLQIGEEPAKNSEIDFGNQVDCLSSVGEVFSSFFEGDLDDAELAEFMDCAKFSFESFEKYTVGANSMEYHPKEIRNFLHRYFLKDKKISDQLLNQVMILKTVIIGGSAESITRPEFISFLQRMEIWKEQLVSVNRHMKIYSWSKNLKLERKFPKHVVEASIKALQSALISISEDFKGQDIKYDLSNIPILIDEFKDFSRWNQRNPGSRPTNDWYLLIKEFYRVGFAQDENVVTGKQLADILNEAALWFEIVLKYQYFIKDHDFLKDKALVSLRDWVDLGARLAENLLDRHDNDQVSYESLEPLINVLELFFTDFPFGLTTKMFVELFPPVLATVLSETPSKGQLQDSAFFKIEYVSVGQEFFLDWYRVQKNLSEVYTENSILLSPISMDRASLSSTDEFSDLRRIIRSIPPLYKKGQDKIILIESSRRFEEQVSHGFQNLTQMNLFRSLLFVAMRAYSPQYDERNYMNSWMSSDDVQNLYEHLKDLGEELKILDPRSSSSGHRSYTEANLFLYISDGLGSEHRMSFEEGMMLVSYLWSGSIFSREIYDNIIEKCKELPDFKNLLNDEGKFKLDIRGEEKIPQSCVEAFLPEQLLAYSENMPSLNNYLQNAKAPVLEKYSQDLLRAAQGPTPTDPNWVEKAEIDVVSMVSLYSESVMSRFNVNGNEYLEAQEVNAAIPVFKEFIQKLAESLCRDPIDNQTAEDVFRHIVETGVIPDPQNWKDKIQLWNEFRARRGLRWKPQFSRGHITSVLAEIISKILEDSEKVAGPCPDS